MGRSSIPQNIRRLLLEHSSGLLEACLIPPPLLIVSSYFQEAHNLGRERDSPSPVVHPWQIVCGGKLAVNTLVAMGTETWLQNCALQSRLIGRRQGADSDSYRCAAKHLLWEQAVWIERCLS